MVNQLNQTPARVTDTQSPPDVREMRATARRFARQYDRALIPQIPPPPLFYNVFELPQPGSPPGRSRTNTYTTPGAPTKQ
jgi:hypothetical protein